MLSTSLKTASANTDLQAQFAYCLKMSFAVERLQSCRSRPPHSTQQIRSNAPAMIAFIEEQDARLCDRTLRSKYFGYIRRRSENWLKQAVLVLVVPFSVLKALGCLLFGSLCNKQLLLSLPAGPLPGYAAVPRLFAVVDSKGTEAAAPESLLLCAPVQLSGHEKLHEAFSKPERRTSSFTPAADHHRRCCRE
jgi:hypothetical protein